MPRQRAIHVRAALAACTVFAVFAAGCAGADRQAAPTAPTARLAAYMSGGFVADDPDGGEARVRLRIEPVHLDRWDLHDGLRMFVALQPEADAPWLQAFYRVVPGADGRVIVESWRFRDDALNAVGSPTPLSRIERLSLDDMQRLEGCDIPFELGADGRFTGEHAPRGACRNSHGGADYVWASKIIEPNTMIWWERGYTDDGEAVWGPESGGYVLERRER